MYGIYRYDRNAPELIAVCYTKRGSNSAARHFKMVWEHETGCSSTALDIRIEEIMTYNTLRVGYSLITMNRKHQQKKLLKLEEKENQAQQASFAQRCKVASLY